MRKAGTSIAVVMLDKHSVPVAAVSRPVPLIGQLLFHLWFQSFILMPLGQNYCLLFVSGIAEEC